MPTPRTDCVLRFVASPSASVPGRARPWAGLAGLRGLHGLVTVVLGLIALLGSAGAHAAEAEDGAPAAEAPIVEQVGLPPGVRAYTKQRGPSMDPRLAGIQDRFAELGVEFPAGSQLLYFSRTATLISFNTREDNRHLGRILESGCGFYVGQFLVEGTLIRLDPVVMLEQGLDVPPTVYVEPDRYRDDTVWEDDDDDDDIGNGLAEIEATEAVAAPAAPAKAAPATATATEATEPTLLSPHILSEAAAATLFQTLRGTEGFEIAGSFSIVDIGGQKVAVGHESREHGEVSEATRSTASRTGLTANATASYHDDEYTITLDLNLALSEIVGRQAVQPTAPKTGAAELPVIDTIAFKGMLVFPRGHYALIPLTPSTTPPPPNAAGPAIRPPPDPRPVILVLHLTRTPLYSSDEPFSLSPSND